MKIWLIMYTCRSLEGGSGTVFVPNIFRCKEMKSCLLNNLKLLAMRIKCLNLFPDFLCWTKITRDGRSSFNHFSFIFFYNKRRFELRLKIFFYLLLFFFTKMTLLFFKIIYILFHWREQNAFDYELWFIINYWYITFLFCYFRQ